MNRSRPPRLSAIALAAALTAVCLAACGSSSSSTSSAAAAGTSATRAKFAACLKQHGVTLPARPAGSGPGSGGGPPPGGAPPAGANARRTPGFFFGGGAGGRINPKFRAAIQACGGGPGLRRRAGALSHTAIANFVSCVRRHGYNLPAPNLSGHGAVFPARIARDAKFQTAARACQGQLRPQTGAGAGAPAPGSA